MADLTDEEKARSGPIEEIKAYFKTVSWLILSLYVCVPASWGYTPDHAPQAPEVIGKRNLGEHLNDVFGDRAKMEAVPYLQE